LDEYIEIIFYSGVEWTKCIVEGNKIDFCLRNKQDRIKFLLKNDRVAYIAKLIENSYLS
jgi:hypothetical protein